MDNFCVIFFISNIYQFASNDFSVTILLFFTLIATLTDNSLSKRGESFLKYPQFSNLCINNDGCMSKSVLESGDTFPQHRINFQDVNFDVNQCRQIDKAL